MKRSKSRKTVKWQEGIGKGQDHWQQQGEKVVRIGIKGLG
jgi:hypothetical protein